MNILLKDIGIIPADGTVRYIKNGSIGISNGIIEFIEETDSVPMNFKADKIINRKNRLAMPGLVNAHTHSAMTIFRNYAGDLSLEEWLFEKIIPAESKLSPKDVYWGSMQGIVEMIKSGTTCFADMYLHIDEAVRAVEESGIRANISKGPITSSVRGDGLTVDVRGCSEFFNTWNNKADGRIKVSVEIHSTYLFDRESISGAAALAKDLGAGIHIHILETAKEKEICLEKYGMNSPEICLDCGVLEVPVFAAHGVHLTDEEMDLFKSKGVSIVHNPTSNLKLGSGIARVPHMLDKGLNVCLGTDGAASNNNMNMFEEMNLAALLHKGYNQNPVLVNADQAIRMATVNGAKAIGFGNQIGSIQKGMKADIIILDTDKPHYYPMNDALSAVVYTAQGSDVDTVIIDGNIIMENKELKTIDEEKVKYQVNAAAERILG
ncbi:MAG: N-ethylammeline chlorohydrolase [Clostridiales bacterium]|nr:N-ethylammeline chlorohydrolase [Clostridiales bacterium]